MSIFNEITGRELGIQEIICNELHFSADICTGKVTVRVGEEDKIRIMQEVLGRFSVAEQQVVAFGDGTADIPVLKAAGLGVAICPSNDTVRRSAAYVVDGEPIHGAIEVVKEHFGTARTDI